MERGRGMGWAPEIEATVLRAEKLLEHQRGAEWQWQADRRQVHQRQFVLFSVLCFVITSSEGPTLIV